MNQEPKYYYEMVNTLNTLLGKALPHMGIDELADLCAEATPSDLGDGSDFDETTGEFKTGDTLADLFSNMITEEACDRINELRDDD